MSLQQRRDSFICKFCDYVSGNVRTRTADIRPIAEEWGFTTVELTNFIEYFREKYYIKTGGLDDFYYRLSITASGVEYVKSVDCRNLT